VTDVYDYLGTTNTAWRITTGATVVNSALDPSGARLAIKTGTTLGFSLADLHANLAAVVNSGETGYLSAVRYDPYGQTPTTSLWDSGGSFPTPWKFQGRLDLSPDSSDPLYDFGARFYAPGIGAFTQLDNVAGSTADPLSLNRYLYAEAKPWTLIDPTGHAAISGTDLDASERVYTTVSSGGNVVRHTIRPTPHRGPRRSQVLQIRAFREQTHMRHATATAYATPVTGSLDELSAYNWRIASAFLPHGTHCSECKLPPHMSGGHLEGFWESAQVFLLQPIGFGAGAVAEETAQSCLGGGRAICATALSAAARWAGGTAACMVAAACSEPAGHAGMAERDSLFEPGPFAKGSVPASRPGYVTAGEQRAVNMLGEEFGCHSCGAVRPGTAGNWVGDHQPISRFTPVGQAQELYPQCLGCSRQQGLDVINALQEGWNPYTKFYGEEP
jgi:RHS repeat-associated protein